MSTKIIYWSRLAYTFSAWLMVTGILLIVFMAGMSVFSTAAYWTVHMAFGHSIVLLAPVLIILAVLARLPRPNGSLLALLLVLYVVQAVLPAFRASIPAVAALHPVNALALFGVAVLHAYRANGLVRAPIKASRASLAAG